MESKEQKMSNCPFGYTDNFFQVVIEDETLSRNDGVNVWITQN